MKYIEFAKKFRDSPYFKTEQITTATDHLRTLRNQLVQWQRAGKVHQLKRGVYTLNAEERRVPLPAFLISNILATPSYVSLESALSFAGMIPERVALVTAVTTEKTATYQNACGHFGFRHLKSSRFFGYESLRGDGDVPLLVAQPEKAILDAIYFDRAFRPEREYFTENLRLQNVASLSKRRLMAFARRFQSAKVLRGAEILASLIDEERS